jgi:hypothetical protein
MNSTLHKPTTSEMTLELHNVDTLSLSHVVDKGFLREERFKGTEGSK